MCSVHFAVRTASSLPFQPKKIEERKKKKIFIYSCRHLYIDIILNNSDLVALEDFRNIYKFLCAKIKKKNYNIVKKI